MKLVLADPKYFKDSIAVISELVNEARFKITKEGMELVAMDPANVAMVIFKLLSSSFTLYELDQDIDICLNLSNLKQVLRRAKTNDVLTIELPQDNLLKITLKSGSKRTFNIPLIDLEEREQKIPSLTFPLKISTTLIAKSSMFTEGSAEINNTIRLIGNGKLIKTALSRLAAR